MSIQNKRIFNLRSVFCGYPVQHDEYVQSAQRFLEKNKPGIFVVGGTNLTGKTNLIKRIKDEGGLTRFSFFRGDTNPPPENCYIDKVMEFSDDRGRPKNIRLEDLYEHDGGKIQYIPEGLKQGVKTIFLPEVWAGHQQALKLVRDELVRKHGCKVVIDTVSSGEGVDFFDSEVNNRFIDNQLRQVFSSEELNLHLLDFNREALREGIRTLAEQEPDRFQTNISIFAKAQRELLDEARRHRNLDSTLANMLGLPLSSSFERR